MSFDFKAELDALCCVQWHLPPFYSTSVTATINIFHVRVNLPIGNHFDFKVTADSANDAEQHAARRVLAELNPTPETMAQNGLQYLCDATVDFVLPNDVRASIDNHASGKVVIRGPPSVVLRENSKLRIFVVRDAN